MTSSFVFFADEEAGRTAGQPLDRRRAPATGSRASPRRSARSAASASPCPRRDRRAHPRLPRSRPRRRASPGFGCTAPGRAGHGSVPNDDNAVVRLAEAVGRIAAHPWPREYIASVRALLDGLSELTGTPYADGRPRRAAAPPRRGRRASSSGRCRTRRRSRCSTPGYKHNVIPQTASASLDCRFLPGHEDDLMATIRELAGEHVEVQVVHRDIALDAPFAGDLVDGDDAVAAGRGPGAAVLPYCLSGGTDNKALQPARHHRLRVRARCGCPRTSTSPRCSTASTSAFPSSRWSSGPGCWGSSSAGPEVVSGATPGLRLLWLSATMWLHFNPGGRR